MNANLKVLGVIIFLVIVITGSYFLHQANEKITKNNKKQLEEYTDGVESILGSKVIIDKDTLTIIDYSIFSQNYTLSNGSKISFKLIEKLEIIK